MIWQKDTHRLHLHLELLGLDPRHLLQALHLEIILLSLICQLRGKPSDWLGAASSAAKILSTRPNKSRLNYASMYYESITDPRAKARQGSRNRASASCLGLV
jgi:hypothetical protein